MRVRMTQTVQDGARALLQGREEEIDNEVATDLIAKGFAVLAAPETNSEEGE